MDDRIEKLRELSDELLRKNPKRVTENQTQDEPFLHDNVGVAINPRIMPLPEMNKTATDFIGAWSVFIKDHVSKGWKDAYLDNTKWTKFLLGTKQSEISANSPLGNAILGHFKKSKVRYRKEDGLFDLSAATTASFIEIMSQHEKKKDRKPVIMPDDFYPTYYEILIEVENEVEKCFEEMTKLTYAKSKLKVLITYNWDFKPNQNYYYVKDILKDNFRKIIRQANAKFPENEETQYMLIVFQRKDDKLFWTNSVFTLTGDPVVKHGGHMA